MCLGSLRGAGTFFAASWPRRESTWILTFPTCSKNITSAHARIRWGLILVFLLEIRFLTRKPFSQKWASYSRPIIAMMSCDVVLYLHYHGRYQFLSSKFSWVLLIFQNGIIAHSEFQNAQDVTLFWHCRHGPSIYHAQRWISVHKPLTSHSIKESDRLAIRRVSSIRTYFPAQPPW